MSYPLRTCKCGHEHRCWALDPRENGRRRWTSKCVGAAMDPTAVEKASKALPWKPVTIDTKPRGKR